MTLTTEERNQLVTLKEKEKLVGAPLTDDERCAIEHNIKDIYNSMPTLMTAIMTPWDKYCQLLKTITSDNSRLLTEIDRLKSLLADTTEK